MKNENNSIKRIIAITTISTLAASGMAYAQTPNSTSSNKSYFGDVISLFNSGKTDEAKALLEQKHKMGMRDKSGGKSERMKGRFEKHGNKKAIEEAIISGNFANFQKVASSSPLKNLNLETFNKLTPQFQAKKNAEDQIRSILSAAGIQAPERKDK